MAFGLLLQLQLSLYLGDLGNEGNVCGGTQGMNGVVFGCTSEKQDERNLT